MSMNYRPEVDGLRTVAVIPVIFFHAGFEIVSGGFVGVDIFFVVSGYLITTIIYNEIYQEKFSIIKFYERRARRILPALFFVTAVTLTLAWFWLLPYEFAKLSESLVFVSLFVSNIYFWQDMGYFTVAAEMKPFLHTWSLAVEEQFYVIFPLVMLVLGSLKRYYLLALVCLAFILSLALAEWGSTHHPSANFYLLPTRAWELMAGSIVALILYKREPNLPKMVYNLGSLAGLGLITYSIVAFDETTPFPGLWALFPVVGAALVILFARQDNLAGQLLSLKPMVGIGLVSYSAYLWHQPLFVLARERSFDNLSSTDYIALSVLSLIMAYFSWQFVEQPFRQKHKFSRAQIFSGSLAGSLLVLSLGAYGFYSQGIPVRLSEPAIQIANVRNDKELQSGGCQSEPGSVIPIEETCEYNKEFTNKIVVWGDSQATPLVGPIAEKARKLDMGVKQFVYTNCLPIAGYTRSDEPECGRFNEEAMEYIIDNDEIKLVVMLGRYPLQLDGKTFDNKEGGVEHDNKIFAIPFDKANEVSPETMANRVDAVGQRIQQTVDTLLDNGKRVVLFYPVPEVGWDVPALLAKEIMYDIKREAPLSTSHEVFKERASTTYRQLDQVNDNPNLLKFKPESLLCDTYLKGRCTAQIKEHLVYYDTNHLSRFGANLVIDHVFNQMEKVGWLRESKVELGWFSKKNY